MVKTATNEYTFNLFLKPVFLVADGCQPVAESGGVAQWESATFAR